MPYVVGKWQVGLPVCVGCQRDFLVQFVRRKVRFAVWPARNYRQKPLPELTRLSCRFDVIRGNGCSRQQAPEVRPATNFCSSARRVDLFARTAFADAVPDIFRRSVDDRLEPNLVSRF